VFNPALAGIDSTFVLSAGVRVHWPKTSAVSNTEYFTAEKYFKAIRSGVGISYLRDDVAEGTILSNSLTISIAPHFELFNKKLVLQPGVSIAMFQKQLDWHKLTFGDMIDERRGFVYNTNEMPPVSKVSGADLSAGIFLSSRRFFGGFAAHHINQPDEGFIGESKLPVKFTGHLAADFKWGMTITPYIIVIQQSDFRQIVPALKLHCGNGIIGIAYRADDALIFSAALETSLLRIGYSYDYTVSELKGQTGGAHELLISFFLDNRKKLSSTLTRRYL
jgi:type IX secretion system PorP/SprF family membrane protein